MKTEQQLRQLEKGIKQIRKDYEKGYYDKIEANLEVDYTGIQEFSNPKNGMIDYESDGSKKIIVIIDIINNSQRAINKYYKK